MSEFLHEGARSASRRRNRLRQRATARTPISDSLDAPRSTSTINAHARKQVQPDAEQLLRDVRGELTQLRQLTGKLAPRRQRQAMPESRISHAATQTEQRVAAMRRVTPQQLPAHRAAIATVRPVAAARMRSVAAVERGSQQRVASSSKLTPAHALRPKQPGVSSLMQAARARRSGRLSFIPRATRVRAQRLLDAIFSKSARIPRVTAATARHVATAAVPPHTARHPQRVQQPQARSARSASSVAVPKANSLITPRPLDAHDLPRLAALIPSFQTTGVAAPGAPVNGSYMAETNEDVHVITRNDRPIASSSELAASSATRAPAQAPHAIGGRIPTMPTAGVGRTAAGGGSTAAGPGASGGGTQQISGTLRITGTEGLNSWISKVEGKLSRG